jgi:hypothetical protein
LEIYQRVCGLRPEWHRGAKVLVEYPESTEASDSDFYAPGDIAGLQGRNRLPEDNVQLTGPEDGGLDVLDPTWNSKA